MKNLFKFTSRFLILIFFFTLINCEKDDAPVDESNFTKRNTTFNLKTKNYNELSQDIKFNRAINKALKIKKIDSRTDSKTVMEEEYGFTIDSTIIKEIYFGNYTSYTFLINRDVFDDSYFENLVIEVDNLNSIKAKIVKYTLNSGITINVQHDSFLLDAKIEVTNINYNNSQAKLSSECVGILTCPYQGAHPAGPACIDADRGDLYLDASMCGQDGGTGSNTDSGVGNNNDSGTSSSGNTGDTGDGTNDNCGNCGSSGVNSGDTSGTSTGDITVTSPVANSPEYLRKKNFIRNQLNVEQKDWFNNQTQETQDIIIDYLEGQYLNDDTALNEYQQESVEFVKGLITIDYNDTIIEILQFLDKNPTEQALAEAELMVLQKYVDSQQTQNGMKHNLELMLIILH